MLITTQTILLCMMATLVGADQNKMIIDEHSMPYVSSEDSSLNLYAACMKTGDEPKPILAYLHGWYGNRYMVDRDLRNQKFMLDRYFLLGIDMRGRGTTGRIDWWGTPDPMLEGTADFESQGMPDSNGWELNDIMDAIEEVKRLYPQHVIPGRVYVMGHSGGGGNTMGMVGKFPDYFCAAYAGSGMSDFGRWAQLTGWRASIEKWVGAKLEEKPSAFASRGGLTTVANRLTPIALSHGTADKSVPFELSQIYVDANAKLGKPVPFKVVKDAGHGVWGHYPEMFKFMDQYHKPPQLPSKGKLVVAGYIKTKAFQILSASIDSTMQCEYNLPGSPGPLTLHLTGGEKGTVTVRYPAGSSKCTVNGKSIDKVEKWHDWQQVKFEYAGDANIIVQ